MQSQIKDVKAIVGGGYRAEQSRYRPVLDFFSNCHKILASICRSLFRFNAPTVARPTAVRPIIRVLL